MRKHKNLLIVNPVKNDAMNIRGEGWKCSKQDKKGK